MKIIITGGSGFIGQALATSLIQKGHTIIVWDLRKPQTASGYVHLNLTEQPPPPELLEGTDAIIHLAGKNIFGRWTSAFKQGIYESRIKSTKNIVSGIEQCENKPRVFISASAAGYYGDRGDEELHESSGPGRDFLASVCIDWEKEAKRAEHFGLRTVQIRTALVLGHGGLLKTLLPLYQWGLGGAIGNGKQWFPWVHKNDILRIYEFALENEQAQGPLNTAAPERVRNKEFSRTLASVLKRPALFRIPLWALRLQYGEFADAIAASQNISSRKLHDFGYRFEYPYLAPALKHSTAKNR